MAEATVACKEHDYVFSSCGAVNTVRSAAAAEKGSGGAWPLRGELNE